MGGVELGSAIDKLLLGRLQRSALGVELLLAGLELCPCGFKSSGTGSQLLLGSCNLGLGFRQLLLDGLHLRVSAHHLLGCVHLLRTLLLESGKGLLLGHPLRHHAGDDHVLVLIELGGNLLARRLDFRLDKSPAGGDLLLPRLDLGLGARQRLIIGSLLPLQLGASLDQCRSVGVDLGLRRLDLRQTVFNLNPVGLQLGTSRIDLRLAVDEALAIRVDLSLAVDELLAAGVKLGLAVGQFGAAVVDLLLAVGEGLLGLVEALLGLTLAILDLLKRISDHLVGARLRALVGDGIDAVGHLGHDVVVFVAVA